MLPEIDGYNLEIDYTYGYFSFLSPTFLRLVALSHYVPFPAGQPFRYLELGCGNGVSLNIHAAACPGEYWGVDLKASHIAFAGKLAEASQANVRVICSSFADLLSTYELPEFDIVIVHGVWTYISDENRHLIIELLRRHLASGGILFLSYNSLPGSAGLIPLQQILRLYSERSGHDGQITERLTASIRFTNKLREAGSKYFKEIEIAANRLKDITNDHPAYVCHEFLHENWRPSSFAEIASTLAKIGMRFVASADLPDHHDDCTVGPKGFELLNSIKDPVLRETALDFLRNKQFRHDLYVKGERRFTESERADEFNRTKFTLLEPVEGIPEMINYGQGAINVLDGPFGAVLKILGQDISHNKTVGELTKRLAPEGIGQPMVIRALLWLTALGIVYPVQAKQSVDQATSHSQKLNRELSSGALSAYEINAVASPVLGSGLELPRNWKRFLNCKLAGTSDPASWASTAWDQLPKKHAGSPDGGLFSGARLLREAKLFERQLAFLPALGISPEVWFGGSEMPS